MAIQILWDRDDQNPRQQQMRDPEDLDGPETTSSFFYTRLK